MWQDYLYKAKKNLQVAKMAIDSLDAYDASVSRSYYAVFQSAIAAVLKLTAYRPKSNIWAHDEVAAQFGGQLIRQRKVFSGNYAPILSDLIRHRHEADYRATRVSKKIALRCYEKAEEFVQRVNRILEEG